MANWWESDPIVAPKKAGAAANWWESDPISKRGTPVPEARPEEEPVGKSPIGRGMPSRANMFRPEKVEQAPIPPTEEELKKSALSGRTVEQMRTGAAAEEIPQTGDFRPVTGREGTQATYNRLYDLLGGILTPEQSAAAKQARVQPLTEAAEAASAAVPLAREKQERAMQFKDENGVPLIDKVNQLMQIRDTTTDPQEQIRAQSQIRDIVRNAPVEFRNLLVDLEGQLEERAISARAAEVAAKNAPAPTQTFARSAAETVGQTGGQQIASTISAAQRVILSPISLIEAVTGQPPNMSREIDKQAKSISDALTGEFKPDEAQMNDLGMKIVSGLTSTGMFAATGPVGAGLRLSRPVSIAIAGALPEAEQGWQEAQRRAEEDPTVDQEWRKWWSFTNRAVTGGTEAIPISRLFSRLEQASGGSLTRAVGIMAANGGEEMVQQGLQDILNNANSIYLLKDPNATIDKDVADNMIVAGLTGALFAGGAVSVQNFAQLRDVYKTPEEAPFIIRDALFPKEPTEGEAEAEAAVAAEPGTAPKAPAAPVAAKQAKQTQDEILADVAMLKASGRAVDDIAMMSERQRKAQAKKIREEQKLQPAALTEEEIQYFTPEPEAPVAPPSPAPAVEAQGPEGVSPPPSVPSAAPSEIAMGLVQQGVPPLEAMQQAAEQRAAAPQPVPIAEPLPSVTPVVEPEPVAEAPKAAPAAPVIEAAPVPEIKPVPKFETVKGNTYGSMNPKRFMTMVDNTPSFANSVQGKSPKETGTGKVKVRIDPALIPQGGKIEDAVANFPKAVKEVIVGKDAYKGLSQKEVARFNASLKKVEDAGGKVTLEGEPPTFEKKARVRPATELGARIASLGGIKGYNEETGELSGEFRKIAERRVPGLIRRKDGTGDMWELLQSVVDDYYPEWKGIINQTRDYNDDSQDQKIRTFIKDLESGGKYPESAKTAEERKQAKLADEENVVFGPYLEAAERAADVLNIGKADPTRDNLVRQAAQLVYDGQFKDPEDAIRALLFKELEEAMPEENVPDLRDAFGEENLSDIDEFLALEGIAPLEADYVPEPSPVPEGRPVSREGGEQAERPAEEVAPEVAGREVEKPVSEQVEEPEEGRLTAEEAQQIIDRSLRPGYKVKLSAKTSRFPEGHTLLISSPTERGRASEPFPIANSEKDLRDWIDGVMRINPEQALKAWEVPFTPVSGLDIFQNVLNEKLGPEYKIKYIKDELHIVTPDKKNIKLDKIGFMGGGKKEFAKAVDAYKASLKEKPEAPVEEKGAEGKPQMVIPGAEKISDKELAERKAEAPMRAKVEQKEAGGLFSDERLQQDIFDSVKKDPEPPKAETPKLKKQPMKDWLINYARKNDVIPIFSNDEVGLVFQFEPNTGRQMYRAVEINKKTGKIVRETKKDILNENLKGELGNRKFLLLKARADAIKADNEYLAQNPDGPFAKGDIVVSKNYPEKLGKVATAWAKMANLPKGTRILFMTPEDAYGMDLAGPYRYINEAKKRLGKATGAKTEVPAQMGIKKFNFIVLKDGLSILRQLESLSHEIGHVMEEELWKSIPPTVKLEMKDAFIKWQAKARKGSLKDLVSNRAYRGQQINIRGFGLDANLPVKGNMSPSDLNYILSFNEFFADQISRYFTSEAKPLTAVDRAFKRIADALRRFYASITGQKYVSDAAFKNWLDAHIESGIQANQNLAENLFEVITVEQRDMFDRSPTPTYTVPEDGFGAQFLYGIVDKYIDSSRVQRAMEAARGSPLPEDLDIEMSIQLMQDKAIAKQNKFYDADVRPMVAFMQTHKISGPEAGRFFYAQHAPERNARMAQRDPSRFDGTNGSGLTTQEALDYLASIPAERRALLDELYQKHLKPILLADLEYRADNGLLTDEQFEAYTKPFDQGGYDFYVPLQGYAEDGSDLEPVEADPFIPNIGKGFAVWGQEFKIAAGRKSVAQNPLYSSIQKRMDGIVRVEKNNTDQVLYNLIKDNPNPELATLHTEKDLPTRAVLRADGTIQRVPNFALARAEETLPLKIGGQQVYIVFNRDNPTSKRLVRSLKSLTGNEMTIAGRALLATGRFMSNINTQWVPDFFITNMPRDVQDALISIYSTKEGFAANFLKEFMRSGNIVRKVAMGQTLSVEEKQHYDEWVESGGRLDFGGFATVERTAKKLEDEFGDLFDKGRTDMETLKRYFEKSGKVTLGAIERFNQLFDDVVRFSVYRAARSDPNNQFSPSKAAQLARRATVDFRQRGEKMPFVNALYPYLSAGINGQRNFIRVLRSKRGQKALATLVLMGIANSMLGVALSEDDETDPTKKKFYTQISDWERAKSFIIPIPINGKYRKISLGFMGLFAFGLGDQVVGYMTGNVKFQDATINVGTSLLSSFVPFWSGGFVDSITPWLFQPGIELITNKNWLGNPIYPDRDTRMPRSSQSFASTPDWAKSAAEFANDWSNGSYTEPGWVDAYPAVLEYFAKFMTQGVGTFAVASFEPFRALMNGESLEAEKLPFMRRTTVSGTADRASYYKMRNDVKAGVAQARDVAKIIRDPKASPERKADAQATMSNLTKELGIYLTPDGVKVKYTVADSFDKADERLKNLNQEIKDVQQNDSLTTEQKGEQIKAKEQAKKDIMNSARKRYIDRNKPPPSPIDELKGLLE